MGSARKVTNTVAILKFIDIIKFLLSLKAAGIDGIYNFFIKHITSLNSHIYEIVKIICIYEHLSPIDSTRNDFPHSEMSSHERI